MLFQKSIPTLRPYQQVACEQVETIWASNLHRVILVLPTGGGKTECAKYLARNARRPLTIAHTRALVEQAARRLDCETTTWQALGKRSGTIANDLIIVDEVHHGDASGWQQVFDRIPATTPILGLTATPWRFTHGTVVESRKKNSKYGKGLGDLFDSMVVGVKPSELVRDGYLVPLEVVDLVAAEDAAARREGKLGPSYDADEHRHTGRIKADAAQRLCPYSAWVRYGKGRKTIVYAHLIASAEQTLERFQAAGVPAAIVHGKLKPADCSRRLAQFARGELRVLVNCMQLTEGVDVPDVECIILDRGCQSLNTYIQICGRAARPAPGKTGALILDLTGASSEHGHPQKDQDYWVVTAENRNVSEMCCTVCGTRVSPMFPTRCMRCDPFRPSVGARREILDSGARIYCRLKDALESACDDVTRDESALSAMGAALRLPDLTEDEQRIATEEFCRARASIQRRAAVAKKTEEEAEMQARIAERRAQEQARRDAVMAQFEAQRTKNEAARKEAAAGILPMLRKDIDYAMSNNWSISWAAKRTRDKKWPGQYDGYNMPPEMGQALNELDVEREGALSSFELQRMLKDERTAKFGQAWCRRKVAQLFGR
jgi:superfamily II DNA or RNA helicase